MQYLFILSIIPSLIIAFLIYKSDKTEKEPSKELIKAFLLGFLAVILSLIASFTLQIDKLDLLGGNLFDTFIYAFLAIAAVEELCKWLCGYLFLKNNKNYDYLFDGIVYFTFISLGFATIENILYTFSGGISTGIIRALTTVPAHAFFGVFSGYYFSFYKREKLNNQNYSLYLIKSIVVPILLHGIYDFCLLTQNLFFFAAYIVYVVSLYSSAITRIKKMMKIDNSFARKNTNTYCENCGYIINESYCSNCENQNKNIY